MPKIKRKKAPDGALIPTNISIAENEKDMMDLTASERRSISWDLYCQGVKKVDISRHVGVSYATTIKDLKHVAAEKMRKVYDSGYIAERKVFYEGTLDNLIGNLQLSIGNMIREGMGHRIAPLAGQVVRAVRTSAEITGLLQQGMQVEINEYRSNDLSDLLGGALAAPASMESGEVVDVEPVNPALPEGDDDA